MQHNKNVKHQEVKMYCSTNHFTELNFLGPHNKPHGLRGLGNHYNMHFDPKIGHVTYEICRIPCACTSCTSSMDQHWIIGFPAQKNLSIKPSNIVHTGLC